MQKKSFLSLSPLGFHKVAYTEWGSNNAARTIICVHGLTRNSRDFDILAAELSKNARVICPDIVGRGESTWFVDPQYYNQAQYLVDLTALIALLGVDSLTWIGTSMGGLLGMYLAAQANSPIQALVLNDVGPVIPRAAIARIAKYACDSQEFFNLEEAQQFFKNRCSCGDQLSDTVWNNLTLHSVMQKPDGSYKLAYDPKVSNGMHKLWFTGLHLWPVWNSISCPVLTLRGARSDVLLPETVAQMRRSGPKTDVVEIPDCGHTPMLMTPDQITIISDWLQQH